jgi:NADH dehydrogenase (ubiquinone) 1 alpha subcomplex subunit 13
MPQDLPPTGGYDPVQYKVSPELLTVQLRESKLILSSKQRNLPARGFRPAYMLVAVAGIMTYGFWKVGKGIREQK